MILPALVLIAVPFHIRPDNFIVDDGYFYPQIARHIVRGEGSTFNGVMNTNGYHPLWMLVCVAGAWITQASGPLLQILSAVQDALLLLWVALYFGIYKVAGKRGAVLGMLPIVFMAMVLGIWRLLEANLALLMQTCTLLLVVPLFPEMARRLGRARPLVLGVAAGLMLLSRLDLLFLAATLFCMNCCVERLRGPSVSSGRLWQVR